MLSLSSFWSQITFPEESSNLNLYSVDLCTAVCFNNSRKVLLRLKAFWSSFKSNYSGSCPRCSWWSTCSKLKSLLEAKEVVSLGCGSVRLNVPFFICSRSWGDGRYICEFEDCMPFWRDSILHMENWPLCGSDTYLPNAYLTLSFW